MVKKKSGAQRRAWERFISNRAPAFRGILRSGKVGRPKGETKSVKKRREWVEFDFLFLVGAGDVDIGKPRWTDLRIASELLRKDSIRWEKYKLGKCQYRKLDKNTLRRFITAARNKFYGTKTPLRVRS